MKTQPQNQSAGSTQSVQSDRSATRRRLRPAGGYRQLASFQTATLIYDATYWFIEKFLDPRSRLADQMLMAARSGRQNLAEGSRFAATSSQTELRLVNTARSSLEELLLDYEDYLFHRHLPQWAPNSPDAQVVRAVGQRLSRDPSDRADPSDPQGHRRALHACYSRWLEHAEAATRANALICLIHQTNYLLDQQITALEQAFIEEGGYSEQLATARLAHRTRPRDPSEPSHPSDPIPRCPQCGKPMALRTAKTGKNAGSQFWGCIGYPDCKGTAPI